jgi:hypothetical protein
MSISLFQIENYLPGKRPASAAPKKIRQARRPPYELTRPIRVIVVPHAIIIIGIHRLGRTFLRIKFDGISKATYVTKKTLKHALY